MILHTQFIACFAKTAMVACTVFTILFENRRSETHSFIVLSENGNLARTVFTTLFMHIKLQAAASYRLKVANYRLQATGCRPQATGYKLQATRLQATSDRLQAADNCCCSRRLNGLLCYLSSGASTSAAAWKI